MFSIEATFSKLKLDDEKYLRDTRRAIQKVIKEAGREFLITAINPPYTSRSGTIDGHTFPVATGEAAGSIKPLGRLLALAQQGVKLGVRPGVDTRYKDGRLRINRIAEGEIQGHARIGETGTPLVYEFFFQTDVEHFKEGPFNNLDAAFEAFKKYVDRNLFERVPKLSDYIFTQNVG